MKNNRKENNSSSFGRLWSYLQAYRFPLYLPFLLKLFIMSVIEPVVIGLAITELTKNTLGIIKGVEGPYQRILALVWFWLFISCVVLFMSWLPTIPTIS